MKRLSFTVVLLSVMAASGEAFELATAREAGLGRGMILSEATASGLVMTPTTGIAPGEWKAELGGLRRYELGELDEVHVAGAYRRGDVTLALGMAQFGEADLYAETTVRVAGGYNFGSLGVGGSLSGRLVSFGGGYDDLTAGTVGLSVTWQYERVRVAVVGDNLTRPKYHDEAEAFGRKVNLFAELIGEGKFSVLGRAEFEEEWRPRFGFGQRLEIVDAAAVFFGLTTEPLTFGGGIDIMHDGARITYAASYHPVLGLTHALAVGYGTSAGR